MDQKKAHASPTKDFFVSMITKDISLQDCILDLLDNCIDGAMRVKKVSMSKPSSKADYKGCRADISISEKCFEIADNCGGILLDDAVNYAFHFGRRRDAPVGKTASIGLYGIGMKRAIFKMGRKAEVRSTTHSDSFRVIVDVDEWLERENDWDFDLDSDERLNNEGAIICIESLYEEVEKEFRDQNFINAIGTAIARDYSIFIQKGLAIYVNGKKIKPYPFGLRSSNDFKPANFTYVDDTGVRVVIMAGMAKAPPDDSSPESPCRYETDYYGWYIVCNDRVVLAGDKTDRTVWGNEGFPAWHTQYYGFLGTAMFYSNDGKQLPWITTKRDVERNSPLYRRTVLKMKEFTRDWLDYTNVRKNRLDLAKEKENSVEFKPIGKILRSNKMTLPNLRESSWIAMTNISYAKPKREVKLAAKAIGDPSMSNKSIGEHTFRYFMEREAPEELE